MFWNNKQQTTALEEEIQSLTQTNQQYQSEINSLQEKLADLQSQLDGSSMECDTSPETALLVKSYAGVGTVRDQLVGRRVIRAWAIEGGPSERVLPDSKGDVLSLGPSAKWAYFREPTGVLASRNIETGEVHRRKFAEFAIDRVPRQERR